MSSSEKGADTAPPPSTTASEAAASSDKPVGNSTSEPAIVKSSNMPSQSHVPSAQHIFSGRPTTGLMCNNLRTNPFSVSDNSTHSFGLIAKPKFNLKPSSLSATGDASSTADPPPQSIAATNPFLRPAKLSYDNDEDSNDTKRNAQNASEQAADGKTSSNDNVTKDEEGSKSLSTEANEAPDTTSVTPPSILAPSISTLNSNLFRPSQSAFVFGEALDSRVTNVAKENGTNGHSSSEEVQKPKMLTLEEAADEYKKQQEIGPTLPEVETVTGEEEESNVLQISCKLFLFQDKTKTWSERGRGCLRLNDDSEGSHSRLVMRTAGIHRVILNTNIWPAMVCERANLKSIRITGTESDQIHVYLITGSPADIDHLHNAVTYRIQRIKQQTPAVSSTNTTTDQSETTTKRKTADTDDASPKRQRQEKNEASAE